MNKKDREMFGAFMACVMAAIKIILQLLLLIASRQEKKNAAFRRLEAKADDWLNTAIDASYHIEDWSNEPEG